jgi:hypothetical protein
MSLLNLGRVRAVFALMIILLTKQSGKYIDAVTYFMQFVYIIGLRVSFETLNALCVT